MDPGAPEGAAEPPGEPLLHQALELWIGPEIERRREAGRVSEGFELHAAQVIFDMELDAPKIRLNEEVKAVLTARVNRAVEAGEPVRWADVTELVELQLTNQDPNAGHLTVLRKPDGWWITFDLRYNATRIAETVQAAEEFLASARSAFGKGHSRAFVDALFSATELLAKGILLMVPDKRLLTSRTHGFVSARYNLWGGKLGNVPRPFVELLNELERMRGPARYLAKAFALDRERAQTMLTTAEEMLAHVTERSPKRAKVPVPHEQAPTGDGIT
jgi:HEPN domain-containing protein